MVYEAWFPNLPSDWEKVAQMGLSRERITPAEGQVSFYVIDARERDEVVEQLRRFATTLPAGLPFTLFE